MDKTLIHLLKKIIDIEVGGWYEHQTLLTEQQLIRKLKGKHILITSYDKITRKVINAASDLKLIACTRSNPVNIDGQAAAERGIPIIHTPGRNADSAAEFTMALMLNIARHIPMAHRELKAGNYVGNEYSHHTRLEGMKEDVTWALGKGSPYLVFKGLELKGKNLGIMGFGQIGEKVAHLARSFGMNVYIYDPYLKDVPHHYHLVNANKLLSVSDFLSVHVPVTKETKGMIHQETFQKMKRTAYLINTSRGAIINEKDLIEALRSNEISGAALDVFTNEPLQRDHPFIKESLNVIMTPHLAGATSDAITNHTLMIIEDIKNFIAHKPLVNQYIENNS